MELYLQYGFGMKAMSEHLVRQWQSGVVILSPRDIAFDKMDKLSSDLKKYNGRVVLDPQFYLPHTEHEKLIKHGFWPEKYQTAQFDANSIREMLTVLKDQYSYRLDTLFFIVPSMYSTEINDYWYNLNSLWINEAILLNIGKDIYCTLCISHEVMRSEEQIHLVLEFIETWDIAGCYIVAEPTNKSYLVDDPIWVANLLDLTAGLKRQGKKVVVGYSNHQMLCLSLSKVDAIASGTWLNVRSFSVEKFNKPKEDASGRRSIWYYCPQSLSEYQIAYLDIAQRMGRLGTLKTDVSFNSLDADILFSGAQPTTVNFSEREAFCHYLQCLKMQVQDSVKPTYRSTRDSVKIQLETASVLTEDFNRSGIRGKERDFSNAVDANLSAIAVFDRLRGMIQDHTWNTL